MSVFKITPIFKNKTSDIASLEQNINRETIKVWERLDPRNVGKISNRELQNQLLNSSSGDKLPDEGVTQLLSEADANKDGFISKNEFYILMHKTKKTTGIRRLVRQAAFLTIPRSGRTLKTRKYLDAFSCCPPPIFILSISLAEIGVFIYECTKFRGPVERNSPVDFNSTLIYNPYRRCEAWRFLTNMFIHSGYLHLVYNLIIQLFLGIILELVHKWWRVMMVYTIGVVGGSLAASIASPNVYLAGASGGVYAIQFAYVGNLILNWSEMKYAFIQALVLIIFASVDFGFAVHDAHFSDQRSRTSHMAHLGGAITGILIGVNVLRNLEKRPWEKYCWWISLVIVVSLFFAAIMIHALAADYFPASDPVC